MRCGLVVAVLIVGIASPQTAEDSTYPWQTPQQVRDCVATFSRLARGPVVVNRSINPYYQRGDFDGDGRVDLAVTMRSKSDEGALGTGICLAAGPSVLLGRIALGKPFSDDPADSVASTGWAIITRSELSRILQRSNPGRHRQTGIANLLATSKGELIYMPFEDAEGLIFFRGGQFRWYTINSTEMPQLP